jgi:protein TonB
MNFDHSRRFLFGALLISLSLHLFLLFGWGRARPLPPSLPQPAIQVVVSARPPAPATAPAPLPVPEKTPAAVPKRLLSPVSPAVEKVQAAPLAPSVSPAPADPVAHEVAVPSPAASPARPRPESEGVSVDGLRQYRIELAGAARRFRNYPVLARSRGWEGVAEISVSVHAGVPSPSVQLVKSSGHGVLDEQALAMLSRAVAATPLPESLQGRSFVVPMPIRFSLEE